MNSSEIGRHPLKAFAIVAALLYGFSVAWFVVPKVVSVVVPQVLRAILNR